MWVLPKRLFKSLSEVTATELKITDLYFFTIDKLKPYLILRIMPDADLRIER